jgi:hypothetical protein
VWICSTKGTFGYPPLCSFVPEYAQLSPSDGMSSAIIGSSFPSMVNAEAPFNMTAPPDMLLPMGFSDEWSDSSAELNETMAHRIC